MFTLRSLAESEELRLTVLVAGPAGALDADVAWVHNTELPDPSPYVGPGELVMTNGLWAEHTGAADFVANVRRSHAAGVVFGLRRSVRRTPSDLVAACREADLPLLELAVEVPFTALSHAAAAAYARRRHDSLEASVRRGDALAEAISRGAGTEGALNVLRREVDLPLAVVERSGRRLAEAGMHLGDDEAAAVAAALTRRPPPLEVGIGNDRTVTLFLVGAFGAPDAALVCSGPPSAIAEFEQTALQQCAHFLSLETARRRAERAIESRFAAELVDMIMSGLGASRELAHRLEGFGLDTGEPTAMCAVAPAHGDHAVLDELAEAAHVAFAAAGLPVVVAPGGRDVICLFTWREDEEDLGAWLAGLVARLGGRVPDRRVVLGYSGVTTPGAPLRTPLVEAREACRILARQASGPSVATFAELPSYSALLGQIDSAVLRRMADTLLGPLREQDASRNTQLEITLRTFLDHGAQFSATAEALFVHVNTLRKRLARIRELTGRDPLLVDGRVDLFLALQADAMTGP
ncbi:PucR family transcriptional regulator [Embleya sp. NPDC001921]